MTAITLAEAKEMLGELIDRVAQGETVEILRDGKPVAQLTPAQPKKKPIDWDMLKSIRDQMPPQSEGAGTFMRRVRDEERY
ncbi:type II toxin-antitoxin system prevent-host-death family antitoxin [Neorhizobium galegae]|uniref:type II toxin-antitoxin system Phd/YefM family antitoxin n=1 Tax=Neorhizobium galegae TaxID=399 RepID=UPI00210087E6|nr:type II toxin-antitoxin system prevent-host-death family antitoxin [Neorhizobium galegae]MCQ1574968.1 type II toxin-antitoxin system prevent-host-death family antitoxin [Neorhizobium galegae]